ncbi:MAG TPA: Y-family DNA polymerase [Rhabdochlamydiaceae bacterium]|jgi:DNA polymerase V|nr:Y-family DNA polymerase [Rhabdochlamydiaceae bacterium]
MFGLIDCNNFFVSCERVFNPKLLHRPVVILSNNDGCVISRSKEAKALKIPMGAPAFQYRETFSRNNVAVLSSNFALYGDMSERVMSVLEDFGFPLEIYSIDEAFLEVDSDAIAPELRSRVLRWTGIPISVGIGATKTLAKVGSDLAKKRDDGICCLHDPAPIFTHLPVEEVWGIGSQIACALNQQGVYTVSQLTMQQDAWIQKHFSITLLRTVLELRGIACLALEEFASPKKGIVCSRSFGKLITALDDLKEAVATFTARGAEKLRDQSCVAGYMGVFVIGKDRYPRSASRALALPTSYTPHLINHAHRLLAEIYEEGQSYRKAGIMFHNITPQEETQLDLFQTAGSPDLMHIVDAINRKKRKRAIFFAAEGASAAWKPLSGHRSAHFTTEWKELLTIRL